MEAPNGRVGRTVHSADRLYSALGRGYGIALPGPNENRVGFTFEPSSLAVGPFSHTTAAAVGSLVTAYLGATDTFTVRWKPQVRALDADLVVACAASTIASTHSSYAGRGLSKAVGYLT